jgi:hypothetical protein
MKNFIYISALLFLGLFLSPVVILPISVNAQIGGQDASTIGITQSPRFPEPNETITISIVSRVINLNNKQTVWEVDGETVSSGTGILEIDTQLGDSGEETKINFRVIVDGEVIQKNATISPVDVNLVWEAIESYTPPFYKGKALNPGWGQIRITALPHIYQENGQLYDVEDLLYTWEYNGLVYGDDSGRGEDSFVVNTVPRPGNQAQVEIETPGGDVVAKRSVRLPINDPEVVLYAYSLLLGPQTSQALQGTRSLTSSQEVELVAYPYFYLTDTATEEFLKYDWLMNGNSLTPPEEKNIIRLRRQEGVRGRARVDVSVSDTSSIFSTESTSVNIEF